MSVAMDVVSEATERPADHRWSTAVQWTLGILLPPSVICENYDCDTNEGAWCVCFQRLRWLETRTVQDSSFAKHEASDVHQTCLEMLTTELSSEGCTWSSFHRGFVECSFLQTAASLDADSSSRSVGQCTSYCSVDDFMLSRCSSVRWQVRRLWQLQKLYRVLITVPVTST